MDAKVNENQLIKAASNFLRGTLRESIADELSGALAPADAQSSKFHGFSEQDDRDLRWKHYFDGIKSSTDPLFPLTSLLRDWAGSGSPPVLDMALSKEATGNAGVSFERLYQRAALVLWPRTNRPAILAEGGLTVSVPFLQQLVGQWESDGGSHEDARRQEARELAASIRNAWPEADWQRKQASRSGHSGTLLDCLSRLGDLDGAAAFLAQQATAGAYGAADNGPLAAVLGQLPLERASELLTATMNVSLPDTMKRWVEQQAQSGRYSNASDYVRDLIRRDQYQAIKIANMQALVSEGIKSGSGDRTMDELRKTRPQAGFRHLNQPMGYTLSRKAEEDIIDVFLEGMARFAVRQAERYHDQLEKSFRFLADNPMAARQRIEIIPPVRIYPIGSHLIIYTVDEKGDLLILRVRHCQEDWQNEPAKNV